jgi:hypothetical protein
MILKNNQHQESQRAQLALEITAEKKKIRLNQKNTKKVLSVTGESGAHLDSRCPLRQSATTVLPRHSGYGTNKGAEQHHVTEET